MVSTETTLKAVDEFFQLPVAEQREWLLRIMLQANEVARDMELVGMMFGVPIKDGGVKSTTPTSGNT